MNEGHGDDIFLYGEKIKANFSSNILQSVDHSALKDHLKSKLDKISNYPEPSPYSVEKMIAGNEGVSVDNIMVTNGVTEAIYLIAQSYPEAKSEIISPTFSEYKDACLINGHEVRLIKNIKELSHDARLIWICNPNNPTGKVIDKDILLEEIDWHSEVIFIIDQAYSDYSVKETLQVKEMTRRKNIILLQSMTKRFMIPGLRIGYAAGNSSLIENIRKRKMPWSVNSLAIEAANFLLNNPELYKIDAETIHLEVERITENFRKMGIVVEASDCNFLLARIPGKDAAQLKSRLIEEGILIRDASNFEGLSEEYFRVSAQSRENNDLLIKAVEKWISLS